MAPTRELAVQIQEDARALGHFLKPRIVTVFGGIDYGRQRDQLRAGCDLLIGTPGRLLDYEQQGATSFGEVESLVVDEADRLFDLGFIKDLRRILRRCPPPGRRHSMLFSATLSLRVMELAYEHLNDARKIEIRPEQITADRVTQVLYHVSQREKIPLLLNLLRREGVERTMLFVNTKRFAERLVSNLERHGFKIGALTGDIPQPRRLKILQDFKSGVLPLLVATDVASRGLHIDGVTHVVNVDLPQDPEDYVHRIGRTARAGQAGKAISLADEDYVFSLDAIQRLIGMKIPVEFADDMLFAARAKPVPPKSLPKEEKTAPPAPKISSKVEEKAAPAPGVPEPERVRSASRPRRAPPRPSKKSPFLSLLPSLHSRNLLPNPLRIDPAPFPPTSGRARRSVSRCRRVASGTSRPSLRPRPQLPPARRSDASGAAGAAWRPASKRARRPEADAMPYATVGGHRFYYEVGGEGETVLLLHGSFADADHPRGAGHGRSPRAFARSASIAAATDARATRLEPLSLADEAAEIAALLDWFSDGESASPRPRRRRRGRDPVRARLPGARALPRAPRADTVEGFPGKTRRAPPGATLLAAFARSPQAAIEEQWLPLAGLRRGARAGRASSSAFETDLPAGPASRAGRSSGPRTPGRRRLARLGEIRAPTVVLVGDREDAERLRLRGRDRPGYSRGGRDDDRGRLRFLHMEDPRHVMRRLTDFYIPARRGREA